MLTWNCRHLANTEIQKKSQKFVFNRAIITCPSFAHLKNSWGGNNLWNEDLIVEELYKIRKEHAAQFNYDIGAIIQALQQEEAQGGCPLVSFISQADIGKYNSKMTQKTTL